MADPLNPSFETAGTSAGEAQSWTQTQSDPGEGIAEFDTVGTDDRPYEDYESGHYLPAGSGDNGDSLLSFGIGDVVAAFFDGADGEDFERSHYLPDGKDWGVNHDSVLDWAHVLGAPAEFDSTNDTYEDFEHEHDDPYGNPGAHATTPTAYMNFADIPSPPAPAAVGSLAPFDTTPEDYEDFEEDFGAEFAAYTSSVANLGGGSNEEGWEAGWTSTMVW